MVNQINNRNSSSTRINWFRGFSIGLVLAFTVGLVLVSPTALAQEESTNLPEETIEKIESVESNDFAYVFCNPLDDLRVTKLIEGAKITAEKFNLNVKFFGPEEPYDPEAVHTILEKIIDQSPKGIAMEIGHPSKFDETIGKAVEKGIYFISFSVDDWTANPRQGYVGYDWQVEGKRLADALFEDMPPLSKVLILDSMTKQGRSNHGRIKGITKRLDEHNLDYSILTVKPEREDIRESLLTYLEDGEAVGVVSLWGEITRWLATVMDYDKLSPVKAGGFGCGDFVKFVRSGSLDVLMKVVTQLEGGIPLENLYYSYMYGVTPSTVELHAKLVKQN